MLKGEKAEPTGNKTYIVLKCEWPTGKNSSTEKNDRRFTKIKTTVPHGLLFKKKISHHTFITTKTNNLWFLVKVSAYSLPSAYLFDEIISISKAAVDSGISRTQLTY